jgi:triacylglycerol lipase
MLARIQQAITLSLAGLALTWALLFLEAGRPGWAVMGAFLILMGYALILALEFIVMAFVHGDDPAPRAHAGDLLRAWWGEIWTAPRVFAWRQPFRSHAEPDHLPPHSRGRRGVLLVHGFFCNRGVWNPWMRALRSRGVPFVAVDLEPIFGGIDDYAPLLDAAVARLETATGLPPLVVAHSMGGLAARHWRDGPTHANRVHHLVTIGTPHQGTWLARFSQTLNGRQMRRDHPWLASLRERETASPWDERTTCFYSHCDNIVFPASTATLPGADNRHLPGTAHVHLIEHPAVFAEVCRRLGLDSTDTGAAPGPAA